MSSWGYSSPPPRWNPVLEYLGNAILCLWNPKKLKYRTSSAQDDNNRWHYRWHLLLFGFGQLFVGASTGFVEGRIYSIWLTNGLNQLSLEVTISCVAWMLTLNVFKWGFKKLPSGEQVVRRQLQIRLQIKRKELKLKETNESFEKATASAETLAADCYSEAWNGFSEFLGFLFAIGFLFDYLFNEGTPKEDVSSLVIVAFVLAPVWLLIVLVFGPLCKKRSMLTAKAKAKGKTLPVTGADTGATQPVTGADTGAARVGAATGAATSSAKDDDAYPSYKTIYNAILWTCVYVLWAFAPIMINPLKNDLGPGTNFVPLPDLLTV